MANRYWVGGSGTWNTTSTTNWSTTSGGVAGASAPTASDAAIFDVNSGSGLVTLGENVTILTFGFATATTINFDYSSRVINIVGNAATVYAGNATSTVTGNPQINLTYAGSTGTRTITPGIGVLEVNSVSFNVVSGADTIAFAGNGNRSKNLTFNSRFTGSFARSNSTEFFGSVVFHSGMTFVASNNTLTFAATTPQTFTSAGLLVDCLVQFNCVGGTLTLQDNLTVGSTRTVTLTNGTLDLNSKTLSCGLFASSNSNTRSIAFGTGNITLTGSNATIITFATATGFTYTGTPTFNLTYSGGTGTRTVNFGGTAGGSETNCINCNISAGTDIIGINANSHVGSLNFTGFTGTFNFGTANRTYYGNILFSSGMTVVGGTATATFAKTSGTQQITTNGQTIDNSLTFNGIGGTFAFQDALTQGSTREFTITNGTVQLKANATSTVGTFATSGTNQKYLQSTLAGSQATLSQASGTVNASYLTIKDINATGGATWNAYRNLNNIDAGNNTGWDFLSTPVTTTTLAMRLGFGL